MKISKALIKCKPHLASRDNPSGEDYICYALESARDKDWWWRWRVYSVAKRCVMNKVHSTAMKNNGWVSVSSLRGALPQPVPNHGTPEYWEIRDAWLEELIQELLAAGK